MSRAPRVRAKLSLSVVLRTLRYRNYRLFYTGQFVSFIGTWMQHVAMSWLVYRLTGSALLLGVVAFSGRISVFLLTPFMGVLADRWDRRRILLVTQTLAMIQALTIAALVFTNLIAVWHIIVLSLFIGTVNALHLPVRQSFLFDMVTDKDDLGNAIALNSTIINGARLLGPTVAGLLIAWTGEAVCFLINGLSYLAVIWALYAIRIERSYDKPPRGPVWAGLKEGAIYAFGSPPLRDILLLVAVVSVMGVPYSVLLPVFAKEVFGGGANYLGFMMASAGAGALAGGFYLASRRSVAGLDKMIFRSTLLFGLSLAGFSLSGNLWLSLGFLTLSGFGLMTHLASCNTLLQSMVNDDKRGRLMSFYTMSFIGMAPFGNLAAGWIASRIGAPAALSIGASLVAAAALLFRFRLRSLRLEMLPLLQAKGLLQGVIQSDHN